MIRVKLATALDQKLRRFLRRSYRDGYLETHVRSGIALQIRALREKAGMSQEAFAEATGKKQSVISRLEDPGYGSVNVNTLLGIARAMDVALLVRFVDYPQFLRTTADMSPSALGPQNIFESAKSAASEKPDRLVGLFHRIHEQPQKLFDQEQGLALSEIFQRRENRAEEPWPGSLWRTGSDINEDARTLQRMLN